MSDATNIDQAKTDELADRLAAQLPRPTGFQIVGIKPKIEETTESGIIKASSFLAKEEAGSVVLKVLELGDLAYKDEERFPSGPWCKPGDYVLLGAYRGSRFSLNGQEFVIFNDDMVMATVEDPSGLTRAY